MSYTYADLAGMIDHSLLNPTLTMADLDEGCRIARVYEVASACVMPYYLARCAELLAGSPVRPGTTIGFPHGGHATAVKVAEAARAVADGGRELDMVVNISQVLSGNWDYVRADIQAVVDTAHEAGRLVKVIFENAYLADDHKRRLCELCAAAGADWVKTSTGYAPTGATDADLVLMRRHTPADVGVKAAGGVRTLDRLLEVRALGVSRVGATRTVGMLEEARRRLGLAPITESSAG
jgi:deoxyribose-phosphate aldolase